MAEKILNTRIQNRIDTLAHWLDADPILKKGEIAIATVPADDKNGVSTKLPSVLIKVGDGQHKFSELDFIYAKAADVHGWAKAAVKPTYTANEITGLEDFITGKIQDTDTQYTIVKVNEYQYKLMSKKLGDESFATDVATIDIPKYDDSQVLANKAAIELLNGTEEQTGSVAKAIKDALATAAADATSKANAAEANAKTYADGHLATAKSYADSLATNYDAAGSAATVQEKLDAEILRAKAAEEANAAAAKKAQDEVDALELVVDTKAAQADLEALETYVGTIPTDSTSTNVVAYVQEKTTGIATSGDLSALEERVASNENYIEHLDDCKLDKSVYRVDMQGVDAKFAEIIGESGKPDKENQANPTLHGLKMYAADKANSAYEYAAAWTDRQVGALREEVEANADAIATEKERAEAAESALDERLDKIELFFEGAAEDEGEGESLKNALDTLKEIQDYINADGAAADAMVKDIADNKKAIEDLKAEHDQDIIDVNAAIALKADQTTVDGIDDRLEVVEGKVSTLEGKMTAVEGAVATKAEQADLEAAVDRIDALEESVDNITDNIIPTLATKEELNTAKAEAAADATSKADQALADAKTYADGINTTLDARIDTLEAINHSLYAEKTQVATDIAAAKEAANAYTDTEVATVKAVADTAVQTVSASEGLVATRAEGSNAVNIAIDDTITFVFNCGDAYGNPIA